MIPEHVKVLRNLGFEVRRIPKVKGKRTRTKVENLRLGDCVISCYRGIFSKLTQHPEYEDRWDLWFADNIHTSVTKNRIVTVVRREHIEK